MMRKVIATVKIENNKKEAFDVEIFSDITAINILAQLCKAYNLGNEINYCIFAIPPNRVLEQNETFEEVGIWDGAILILQKNRFE